MRRFVRGPTSFWSARSRLDLSSGLAREDRLRLAQVLEHRDAEVRVVAVEAGGLFLNRDAVLQVDPVIGDHLRHQPCS
jgi:hypothetical protein